MTKFKTVENSSSLGSRPLTRARRFGVVLAVSVFGLAAANTAAASVPCGPEGAPLDCVGGDPEIYPIETTTTTEAAVSPPVPTVTLPETGSSNVGNSVMIGSTIALSGVGLVIVTRRRRRDLESV
jgi:LPXTG-motif cell wall-anchored protein